MVEKVYQAEKKADMSKEKWVLIRDYSVAWTVALMIYTLVRTVGTTEDDGVEITTAQGLVLSPLFGTLFGVVFGLVQLNFERLYNKRTPMLRLFLLGTAVSVTVITAMMFLAYFVFIFILEIGELSMFDFFFSPSSFIFYGYIILVDILVSLFRQVSLMLGPGVLKKLMRGEFYNPREEDRIFMFLDLKSSTEMAENLGHLKYSRMIQDCFNDLAVVSQTEAQVYQYVGDEVVLTWPSELGLRNANCIQAYYRFKAQIDKREAHYLKEYGRKPFFKAGINMGKVTVAEVGKTKKEIAYHGDTVNTAARIQGKCNEFESELLISESLKKALGNHLNFDTKPMGDIPLKGKAHHVSIHAVAVT